MKQELLIVACNNGYELGDQNYRKSSLSRRNFQGKKKGTGNHALWRES